MNLAEDITSSGHTARAIGNMPRITATSPSGWVETALRVWRLPGKTDANVLSLVQTLPIQVMTPGVRLGPQGLALEAWEIGDVAVGAEDHGGASKAVVIVKEGVEVFLHRLSGSGHLEQPPRHAFTDQSIVVGQTLYPAHKRAKKTASRGTSHRPRRSCWPSGPLLRYPNML